MLDSFPLRAALGFVHAVTAVCVAWLAAFALRFNFDIPDAFAQIAWFTLPWAIGALATPALTYFLALPVPVPRSVFLIAPALLCATGDCCASRRGARGAATGASCV